MVYSLFSEWKGNHSIIILLLSYLLCLNFCLKDESKDESFQKILDLKDHNYF